MKPHRSPAAASALLSDSAPCTCIEAALRRAPLAMAVAALLSSGLSATAHADTVPPSDSAYATDAQESFVEDQTSQAIGTVNMVTCFVANTKPDVMVNRSAYAALVDMNRCDPNRRGNTSSDAPEYTRAVIDSTRSTNNDPMVVKGWVENTENGSTNDIYLKASISQAPSATLPYGVFTMDYAAPNPAGGSPKMQGRLDATPSGLSFIEVEGAGTASSHATQLFLNAGSSTAGSGAVRFTDPESHQLKQMTFAYTASNFLRSNGSTPACFSRNQADAKASAWRYGLYDATSGARVERNAGFPISATTSTGRKIHGFIGAYGLSAPEDQDSLFTPGMTVQREAGPGQASTSYTLVRTGGKLFKHTKATRSLASLDGLPFDVPPGAPIPGLPGSLNGKTLSMVWDQATTAFIIKGKTQCDERGCRTSELSTPLSVSATTMAAAMDGGLRGFSQALNAPVFIPASAMTDPTTNIVYRVRTLMQPGSTELANLTLYCLVNCPTPAALQSLRSGQSQSPFGESENRWGRVAATGVVTYGVDAVKAELTFNGTPVAYTGGRNSLQGSRFGGVIQTSALVTSLPALTCPNSPANKGTDGAKLTKVDGGSGPSGSGSSGNNYCQFNAEQQDAFYTWETGPNPFNHFAGLKDSTGALVQFDQPLRVEWSVPNDRSRYDDLAGKKLTLEYTSFGNLSGLPGHCVDRGSNAPVACEAGGNRYVPKLMIPDNTTEGVVTVPGTTTRYLVKWLQRELRFAKVADAACTGMTVGDLASLPSTSTLTDPSSATSSTYIGAKPAITDAPKVIHGVVQP